MLIKQHKKLISR